MTKVIGVRFRTAGKIYFFSPGKLEVETGDKVIVETARGVEFGSVVTGPKEVEDDKITQPLKSVIRLATDEDKKKEEKIKELQDFISRFSANASKSKQATSRKRALEKIQLDEIRPSSRKYPYIDFRPNREIGNDVLQVEGLTKTVDGVKILDNLSFTLGREDKVAFVGSNEQAITMLFKILTGEEEPDSGYYK